MQQKASLGTFDIDSQKIMQSAQMTNSKLITLENLHPHGRKEKIMMNQFLSPANLVIIGIDVDKNTMV